MPGFSGDTVQSLSANLKEKYGESFMLVPEKTEVIQSKIAFASKAKVGDLFKVMANLSLDHSVTFHGDQDQNIDLRDPVVGVSRNAEVRPSAMSFNGLLTQTLAERAKTNAEAFEEVAGFVISRALQSFAKVIEQVHWYGQSGLARTTAATADLALNQITIQAAEWGTSIWAGGAQMPVDIYTTAGILVLSTTVTAVNTIGQKLTLASVEGLVNGTVYDVYRAGSRGLESAGLHKIFSNTGSLFGIDASQFDLWRPNSFAVAGNLSYTKFAAAVAQGTGRGLMGDDYELWINSSVFPSLIPDFNTTKADNGTPGARHARIFPDAKSTKMLEHGTEKVVYHVNDVAATIKTTDYCKIGYGYLVKLGTLARIGSGRGGDVSFIPVGSGGELFRLLEKKSAYEFRSWTDQALFTAEPNKNLFFSGITI